MKRRPSEEEGNAAQNTKDIKRTVSTFNLERIHSIVQLCSVCLKALRCWKSLDLERNGDKVNRWQHDQTDLVFASLCVDNALVGFAVQWP